MRAAMLAVALLGSGGFTPLQSQSGALFLLFPFGARSVAMGDAVSADTALGVEGTWWNAAALSRLKKKEVSLHHSQTFLANSEMLVVAVPSKVIGTVAVSAFIVDYGELQATDGNTGAPTGVIYNRNYLLAATYASPVGKRLGLGLTYKWIVQRFNSCNGVCSDAPPVTGATSAVDIGLQYALPSSFPVSLGLSIRNVGPNLQTKDQPQADPLPRVVQVGVMSRLPIRSLSEGGASLDVSADVISASSTLSGFNFGVGAALGYRDQYFLRGGYKRVDGEGSAPSLGLGFQRGAFGFDFGRRFDALGQQAGETPTYVTLKLQF